MGTDPRELYHAIHPHPALSPVPSESSLALDQALNERVWRELLIQAALSLLLPPEDLENPCLKVLVGDILSELIVGKALCGTPCEGWFMWETIIKLIELACPPASSEQGESTKTVPPPSRLEQFGLLSDEKTKDMSTSVEPTVALVEVLFAACWQLIRYSTILFVGMRTLVTLFSDTAGLPTRIHPSIDVSSHTKPPSIDERTIDERISDEPLSEEAARYTVDRPILGMSAWSFCSHLLSLDLRMPWLTSICGFLQWFLIYGPGGIGYTNSRLDR